MLDIDGVGMGVNWMVFFECMFEVECVKVVSQVVQ